MTDQSSGQHQRRVPWHVLPRKAANVTLRNMKAVRNATVATGDGGKLLAHRRQIQTRRKVGGR